MQDFLELYQDYQGSNDKIISYAAELKASKELNSDLLDEYDERREELEGGLEDQEEEDNRSYSQNRTNHERLFELGLFT